MNMKPSIDDTLVAPASAARGALRPATHGDTGTNGANGTTSLSPSVALDISRLERAGHVVPHRGRSLQNEEFRRIKHQLLQRIRRATPEDGPMTLICVTSALPGEGKTTTAINLALSLSAEIDLSVLLVDADVLRPEVLHRLGVPPSAGLLDALSTPGMAVQDVILSTNVPKLSVLPAGRCRENAAELLSSDAMTDLLDELVAANPNRIIVFDAPPLLLSTEARTLAHRMGQIVVVVEAGKTPRSAVTQAFDALDDFPHVYAVLNKSSEPSHYGYGDYYG
jgi:receptor protein-tyrosine kinase